MDPQSRSVAVVPIAEVPVSLVRYGMAFVILALAVGGLATQTFGILTGHDSMFGLIPKLNPAGTRNLPVWFASMTLAGAAVSAALAAAAARTHHRALARGWWAAAGILLVLSIGRMAAIGRLLSAENLSATWRNAAIALLAVMACVLGAIVARSAFHLSRTSGLRLLVAATAVLAGAVMCNIAAAPDPVAPHALRVGHAVWMTAGRALELTGLMLFILTVIMHIRAEGRPVFVRICDDCDAHRGRRAGHSIIELRLSPRRVRFGLMLAIVGVTLTSALAVWARLQLGDRAEVLYRLLNVDFEGNLPTWISAVLLLLGGAAAGIIAAAGRHARDRNWGTWALLAAVFVVLSADEAASFHELMVEPLRALVGGTPWLRYPLILPGLVVVIAGAIVFGRLLATLDVEIRRGLYRGAGVFFLGALGVETIGGWFDPTVHGENAAYVVLSTIEEACEMTGAAIVFVTLMQHAERAMGTLRLSAGRRAVPMVPHAEPLAAMTETLPVP